MQLSALLRYYKHICGMTTEQLCERSGVPRGTVNKLLNGETLNPTRETLTRIASALGIEMDALSENAALELRAAVESPHKGRPRKSAGTMPKEARRVPLVKDVCDGELEMWDVVSDCAVCPDTLRCDYAIKMRGDSMIGARIADGDTVFVRAQPNVRDGELAAVIMDRVVQVRRVYHESTGLMLLCENTLMRPAHRDDVKIVGLVVGVWSEI